MTRGTIPWHNPATPSSFQILDKQLATLPPYAALSVISKVLMRSSGAVIAAEKLPATAPHVAASTGERLFTSSPTF